MIRILHVFSYFRPDFTGEGVYYEKIRAHFADRGVTGSVLAVKTCQPAAASLPVPSDNPVAYLGMSGRSGAATAFRLAVWLFRHARQFDAVHFHAFADRYFAGHLMCRLLSLKVLQSCTLDDSPGTIFMTYRPIWRKVVRRLLQLPDRYITISPRLHDSALRVMPRERVHLIPQGVEIPDLPRKDSKQARAALGFSPDDIVLLFVGGICERKGVDFLITAMPALVRHCPSIKLLVVGPDLEDRYAASVRQMVIDLNLSEHVVFAGALDNVNAVYRICDIFVFASHMEGFGNVLLEAMAHALPTVSRRLAGVTDAFITHGETGLLFDDKKGYVSAVKSLIDDPDTRNGLGITARHSVMKDYEMSAVATRYVDLYTDLVNAHDN